MSGFNRIIMTGNLTRDPEYKQLSSGQALCRLGLATNRQYKNRQTGNMVQEVCYVDIDVWGAQAETCRQYLQKGKSVLVEGRLKLDSWKDNEGQNRSKHSIVADRVIFLSSNASSLSPERGADVEIDNGMENNGTNEKLDPRNALEKDILDQLDSIKNKKSQERTAVRGAKKIDNQLESTVQTGLSDVNTQTTTGEVSISDEQPFDQ